MGTTGGLWDGVEVGVGVMDIDSSESIILFSSQSILFTWEPMNGVR